MSESCDSSRRRRSAHDTPPPLAVLVLALGLTLSGCAGTDVGADTSGAVAPAGDAERSAAAGAAPGATPTVPAEAGHLHGLGLDPGDGRLYLGTHAGLMVVEPDGVSRVGQATIDLMGFAVAGSRALLRRRAPRRR